MGAVLLGLLLSALYTPGAAPNRTGLPDNLHVAPLSVAKQRDPTPSSKTRPAKGRFLVASRTLTDLHFSGTVVLLLASDAHGNVGVVINRPTDVPLASALPDVKELHDRPDRIFLGGPVGEQLMMVLIRSAKRPKSAQSIFDDVYASGSVTTLRAAVGRSGKTERFRAYLGYAGWAPGQLEQEIARGDWYVAPGDAATLFDAPPADIWEKLVAHFSGQWIEREHEETAGAAPFIGWIGALRSWRGVGAGFGPLAAADPGLLAAP